MARRHRPEHSIVSKLDEADALIERKQWVEARELLEDIDARSPNREDVLSRLLDVYAEMDDMPSYQIVCERLLRIRPNHPDYMLAFAGACLGNVRPASALLAFRRFLDRYPDHERAAEARQTLAGLESRIDEMFRDLGFTGTDAIESASLHEQSLALIDQGKYAQARHKAEELLKRHPDFVSALNNVGQAYFAEGHLDRAIEFAERALALDDDNFHALGNLTRYYCLKGRLEQAQSCLERLKRVDSKATDVWLKKMEAASTLGDDRAVLAAFEQGEHAGALKPPLAEPFLYHLAAVAQMRLGNEKQARGYWQKALALMLGYDLAQENLDDLSKPVGERHAPWAFEVGNWISRPALDELLRVLKPVERRGEDAMRIAARRYLDLHPEIIALAPILFDRGDQHAREFALHLVEMAKMPELLAAARDFALSQRGPDEMRHTAARLASEAGLIPAGAVRMWMRGKWTEVMLLDFEFVDEPTVANHSKRVSQLLVDALDSLHNAEWKKGEELLLQGLAIEPGAPDLINNLAMAYERQGRNAEYETLLKQNFERHPDYSFGRIALVRWHLRRGEIDRAEEMLKPMLERKKWNYEEFAFFCAAQIDYFLARKMPEGARSWFDMWEGIDPDDPMLDEWRVKVKAADIRRRILGR